MAELSVDELNYFAAKAKLPKKLILDTASETIDLFFEVWNAQKNDLPISKDAIGVIDKHAQTIQLVKEFG